MDRRKTAAFFGALFGLLLAAGPLPAVSLTVQHGLYVARATPQPLIARLNAALRAAVNDPAIVARIGKLLTDAGVRPGGP